MRCDAVRCDAVRCEAMQRSCGQHVVAKDVGGADFYRACFWPEVGGACFKECVAKHAVLTSLFTVAAGTQSLQPRILIADTMLLNVVHLKVTQHVVAVLALPFLAHGHRLFFGGRQRAAGRARAREDVVEVAHLLRHPGGQKNAAAGRFNEELAADTCERDTW